MISPLGVGVGPGLFNAPVVSTAIRAVPPGRSGLASGVNNTARQAGTAMGVAIFGAIAGAPADAQHFVAAMRALGVTAAILWLLGCGPSPHSNWGDGPQPQNRRRISGVPTVPRPRWAKGGNHAAVRDS